MAGEFFNYPWTSDDPNSMNGLTNRQIVERVLGQEDAEPVSEEYAEKDKSGPMSLPGNPDTAPKSTY
jgi:hypothetical protein